MTSRDPLESFPPGVHAFCVLTASVLGPMVLAISSIGSAMGDEFIEVVALASFAPVFMAMLILVLASRGAVIGDRAPGGIGIELEILAFQTELFRDRSLRKSLVKLGLHPRPFIVFRRVSLVVSVLITIVSLVVA